MNAADITSKCNTFSIFVSLMYREHISVRNGRYFYGISPLWICLDTMVHQ